MKFKDLFNEQSLAALAGAIQREYPGFERQGFLAQVFDDGWDERELKERMRHITIALHGFLAEDYRAALEILRGALPHVGDHGIVKMVFPDYVEVYGLDDWDASMPTLEEFTQQISAEFAIRPFIVADQERTMAQMLRWAGHPSPEVRRLASEGCRPRLPWGIRLSALQADPSPILPILDELKRDESESVRRSVANNLNDISKDHPDLVIELLRRWQADAAEDARQEIDWITKYALRTLLKQGDSGALELTGHARDIAIAVSNLAVQPQTVPMGGEITLSFDVQSLSDQPQELMIDYIVHHMRANGKLSPKVFKLTKRRLEPGAVLKIARRHSFAPVTTRRYYAGEHAIEPQINGKVFGRVRFALSPARETLAERNG